MNKAERADLIQVLQDSEANLLSTLKQTNEDLFQFKPDSDTWSMAELVEHLAITDQTLLAALLKKGERLYEETPETFPNPKIIRVVSNRNHKVKAPEHLVPQGRFKNKTMGIQGFRDNREKVENFVTTTELPLDKIAFPHFALGLIDGKGWITFMAGHCQRHTEQMEEIMEAWKLKTS
ncbi:MAG: hypothetical protein ACI9LN_000387 [Saprospiraceae bacterium]|jgi:hypothetical protein